MLILRVDRERRGYFLSRLPEWLAALALFALGTQFILPGDGFALARVYSVLAGMADERGWALLALTIASTRLVALILNGFFPVIRRITPAVRCLTAFLSGCIWLAIAIGLLRFSPLVPTLVAHAGLAALDFAYASVVATEAAWVIKEGLHVRGR